MAHHNSTVLGFNEILPSITDYYSDLKPFTIASVVIGGIFFLITFILYVKHVNKTFKRTQAAYRWRTLGLISLNPFVALMAFTSILIPRVGDLCQSAMHVYFCICVYIFYKLLFQYVGGEQNYLDNAKLDVFNMRTPPFCCCCPCIKPLAPTEGRMNFLRCVIFQLPIIQIAIVIILQTLYYVDFNFHNQVYMYFIPFITSSLLTGVWGLNILFRLINQQTKDYKIRLKYICLQLILIICKVEAVLLKGIYAAVDFPNDYPLTPNVYKQSIFQLIVLGEVFLLTLLTRRAYDRP